MSTLFDTAKQVNFFEDLNPEEIKYATIKAEVAVALFRKRKELGMTQAAFAKYMDVTQSTISKWESGDHIRSIGTSTFQIGINNKNYSYYHSLS